MVTDVADAAPAICPHCGWAVHTFAQGSQRARGRFQRHINRCATATPKERAYFTKNGFWSQYVSTAPVVAGKRLTPAQCAAQSIRYRAWIRDVQGRDKHVGYSSQEEKVQELAHRMVALLFQGHHAAAFITGPGVDPDLPTGEVGDDNPSIQPGIGGHWERVATAAQQQYDIKHRPPKPLSRRENGEQWLLEERLAQDRARCVEDTVLSHLRMRHGKWVTEEELFAIPNATIEETLQALKVLQSCNLVESHGVMWRRIL